MDIKKDTVVTVEYRLHLGDGKYIDESDASDPLIYLHGHDEVIPGLEKALEGKKPGDSLKAVIPPEDGYGDYDPEGVDEVPREDIPADLPLEAGGIVEALDEDDNEVVFLVKEIKDNTVVVDFNHPMAGKTLHYELTVRDVRAATEEELEHGHAHAPGHEH